MIRPSSVVCSLFLSVAAQAGNPYDLTAANPDFKPLNQLRVSGNACGPAALLSAFGFGSARWQALGQAIPGNDDRVRISQVIRGYGLRESPHLGRPRWSRTGGINLIDLTDVANEIRGESWLPILRNEVLILRSRESLPKLLNRAHKRLAHSLDRGFPPIVSLQRLAMRPNGSDDTKSWHVIHGHFVVIIGLPKKLGKDATALPFRYADPWGGRVLEGTIKLDAGTGYPALLASTPETKVGARYLKDEEQSIVTLAAILGAF